MRADLKKAARRAEASSILPISPSQSTRLGGFSSKSNRRRRSRFSLACLTAGPGASCKTSRLTTLASLGKSNGERPFRLLAQPITFQPRSTMRLQIIEHSQDIHGKLFIVLYGYQVIGSSACPEVISRKITGPPMCPTETIGSPSARVIPFDYVTTFQLTGRPLNQIETEVVVNAEGGFVATSIGYGLLVEERAVPLRAIGGISGETRDRRRRQQRARFGTSGRISFAFLNWMPAATSRSHCSNRANMRSATQAAFSLQPCVWNPAWLAT